MKRNLSILLTALVCTTAINASAIEQDASGYYLVTTPEELCSVSSVVNAGNSNVKIRLVNDLDMSSITNFPSIGIFDWPSGPQVAFQGEFDGQGHIIYNLTIDNTSDAQETGLFGRVNGGGYIHDFGVVNANITANARAGVVAGEIHASTVDNVFTAGNLVVISNNTSQYCGLSGEGANSTFNNCYTTFNGPLTNIPERLNNCYWGQDAIDMAETGELCYKLNGDQQNIVWRQNLGEDKYPVQDKTHAQVYQKGQKDCGGNIIGAAEYTNEAQDDILPPHQYDETGICIVCGNDVGKTTIDDDGYMAISNPWQMRYFATYVNSGNYQAKARLTEDIDMSAIENFPMLGYFDWDNQGSGTQFGGEIDGQGHVIKNLRVTVDARVEAGFCSRAGGATFRNLGFENATITNTHADGVRAGVLGGELFVCNVINCWSFGDIQINTTYYQKGGFGGEAAGTNFTNCWTTYNAIGDSPNSVINTYWGQDVANMHASGELCYKLNGDQQNIVWRQNLGEDEYPVLDSTHGIVKEITDAGYATMYLPETSVTIPAGVEAFTGIIAEDYLVMNPIESVVIKGQAVVLKGNEGYYSFIPTDAGVGLIQSDLIGTDEPLQANGSQYVLAEKDGVIGFYKAEGIIPAGKAYLLSSSGVKAFLFEFDDATGIANVEKAVENGAIYNLAGQRQNKIQKGINIVNGKKISK